MTSFTLESELIAPVLLYFYKKGWIIFREVKIGFCRADLVIFTHDHKVISVELKLADWKKALIQAQNYQLGSDYVYIAFPDKKKLLIETKANSILSEKGIGLLFIDSKTKQVREYMKPKQSKNNFGTISLYEIMKQKKSVGYNIHRF